MNEFVWSYYPINLLNYTNIRQVKLNIGLDISYYIRKVGINILFKES